MASIGYPPGAGSLAVIRQALEAISEEAERQEAREVLDRASALIAHAVLLEMGEHEERLETFARAVHDWMDDAALPPRFRRSFVALEWIARGVRSGSLTSVKAWGLVLDAALDHNE